MSYIEIRKFVQQPRRRCHVTDGQTSCRYMAFLYTLQKKNSEALELYLTLFVSKFEIRAGVPHSV